MKNISLLTCLLLLNFSCGTSKKNSSTNKNDSGDLIGIVNKESFLMEPFNEWFLFNYNDYKLNKEVTRKLKPFLKDVTIKTFMGTWCGDSQEQTPAFYKILDTISFNYKNLDLIALNSDRKTPDDLQKSFNIIRVPTFIFYKNDKEIGRIVEYPRESLEEDILKILRGKPYKHSYQE